MDVIREIVTSIIIVLVLAALLEMILPNSAMQRFVKVIMGLFIIITLLNPLVRLINEDLSSELTSLTVMDREEELQSILAKGKEISDQSKEKVLVDYEKKLAQQIVSVANFTDGSRVIEAKVKVSRVEDQKSLGKIEEVVLVIGEEKKDQNFEKPGVVEPIDPIKVEASGQKGESQARDPTTEAISKETGNLDEAVDAITSFYGIPKEQIKVIQAKD